MTTWYLVGYPLASIIAWQCLVMLSTWDWQSSCDNYCQQSFNMLNNSVSWEVTVHNHCMLQFDLSQTWITAYLSLTKN